MKRTILTTLLTTALCATAITAQTTERMLTLDECRQLALQNSGNSQLRQEAIETAELYRKAALAAMMPRASVRGAYSWNSQDLHLLSNQLTTTAGTVGVGADGSGYMEWANGQTAAQAGQTPLIGGDLQQANAEVTQAIADAYKTLYDQLTVDMTHIVAAQATVTQPIYTGGRLSSMYKIAASAEKIARIEADSKEADLLEKTDEAYWRVFNVAQKQELAHRYYDLLAKLQADVKELQAEGLATQSDLLKVTAKLGEAEVKRLQADNGLVLSKMALCQLTGLPLESPIRVSGAELDTTGSLRPEALEPTDVEQRRELQLLEEAQHIADQHVRLAAAGLQPSIVAQAGYLYTNPYATNGLSNDFRNRGSWNATVVMSIPIAHADDIYRLKAAKKEAHMAQLKVEESRELLTMQNTQARQKLTEAEQKVVLAQLNLKNAAEVLHMAQESFDAGMIPVGDLMQAQTAWLSASTDRIDALVELQTAAATLKKYSGN